MTEEVVSSEVNPTSKSKKDALSNWIYIVFVTACTISFFVALIFALEFPLKFALILGLTPIGVGFLFLILFFCILKWDFNEWRENYENVFVNDNYTRVIKSILLPILLVGLYFYIKEEESANILYAQSPVNCDMIIHPCGSSFYKSTTDVWDAADLITQPSENEIFIVTNAFVDLHQTRKMCGQTGAYCSTGDINPGRRTPTWLKETAWIFSHDFRKDAIWNPISCPESPGKCEPGILYDNGIQTDECDASNRFCNIYGWCPPVKLDDFEPNPTFQTEDFTLFLDLKPNFPQFHGVSWSKGGENGYSANYAEIYAKHYRYSRSVSNCVFHSLNDPYCPRFRLQDIVTDANNGDPYSFNETATYGGILKIEVEWKCHFDWGQDIFDCLPNFRFLNRATNKGKPKIFPKITSQDGNNRIVSYLLGINISIAHIGVGQQIQIFSLVLYAQFVFVSFQMIKSPFIWVVRCLIATVLTAKGK